MIVIISNTSPFGVIAIYTRINIVIFPSIFFFAFFT